MAKDYKIKYKDPEDNSPHVKYVHAVDENTAKTMFEHSWVHIHGDNSNDCPEIVDVEVLNQGESEEN